MFIMKKINWMGSSYKDLISFPKDAKQLAGFNLDRVQRGLEPKDWKPMASIGTSVKEIRIHTATEYRIIYLANRGDAIYVLHSFVKKTEKTSKKDLELASKRFKEIK